MAFTRFPDPTNNISNLANQPVEPPATLKQKFDQFGEDSKDWTNNVFLPELESTTNGDSGADNIGATALSGGVATTVQGIVEELDAKIDTQLPTPDGSITDAKLSNTAGQIKDVVSKMSRQNSFIVYLEDFGGGADNVLIDNSIAFKNASDYLLANKGGTIQFLNGVYTFITPISFSVPFSCINVNGVSVWNGTFGTKLNWTGTGYLFNFLDGGQYYNFEKLYIECHDNYGFLLKKGGTMSNFKSRIKDVFIRDALRSIDLDDYIYFFMDNVIIGSSNVATERGIKIGSSNGLGEFLYIEKCSVDGYSACNCDALIILEGNNIYIDKCDFANFGTGKAINITSEYSTISIDNVSINDCNVIRCDNGIYIEAKNANITQIAIDKTVVVSRGTLISEIGIYTTRQASFVISGLNIKNACFRKLGATTPTYSVYISDSSVNKGTLEIQSNLTTSNYYLGGVYGVIKFISNDFRYSRRFTVVGDTVTKIFTLVYSAASPFTNSPVIGVVGISNDIDYKMSVSNTHLGTLSVTVTFLTAPPTGNIFIYTMCSDEGFN